VLAQVGSATNISMLRMRRCWRMGKAIERWMWMRTQIQTCGERVYPAFSSPGAWTLHVIPHVHVWGWRWKAHRGSRCYCDGGRRTATDNLLRRKQTKFRRPGVRFGARHDGGRERHRSNRFFICTHMASLSRSHAHLSRGRRGRSASSTHAKFVIIVAGNARACRP